MRRKAYLLSLFIFLFCFPAFSQGGGETFTETPTLVTYKGAIKQYAEYYSYILKFLEGEDN